MIPSNKGKLRRALAVNDAYVWLGMAGVLAILEIFSGTFYLLMIALAMLAGALAAWWGASNPVQMLVVAVVGVTASLLLHRKRRGRTAPLAANADPNVNLDIGQTVKVEHWKGGASGPWLARVSYRGAQWDVELEPDTTTPGQAPHPGWFVIREIRGSRLLVGVA